MHFSTFRDFQLHFNIKWRQRKGKDNPFLATFLNFERQVLVHHERDTVKLTSTHLPNYMTG